MALRLVDLAALRIFGDSASSVFFASQPWHRIAAATAVDSHPPAYYYLLRLSLDTFGWTEVGARLPSLVSGVALVAVVMAIGRRLGGPFVAIAAGLVTAASPPLIVYSRQPRMYALVALISLAVLALALRRPARWTDIALAVTAFAGLMTHYFVAAPVAVAGLARLWRQRRPLAAALRGVAPLGVAGVAWIPWLAYALPESIRHTAQTISGTPPPETIIHFVGGLAVFLVTGAYLPVGESLALAGVGWAAIVMVALISRRRPGWPLFALLGVLG
ncbi:MAG: glycosyltransferase family 39 protein, partial [Dehalococcoidia bacterium]|nr:glycosyltransferase family 39 protein [Dehalococcoidia bacterium]